MLQAIRVHTTLPARPTPLDLLVFLADKLEWDQGESPPYGAELRRAPGGGLRAAWEAFGIAHNCSTPPCGGRMPR